MSSCGVDYDRVQELANEHKTLPQMLGHAGWAEDERDRYALQTIKDNLRRVRPLNNVPNRSTQPQTGRSSARTAPIVRWCAPVHVG